MKKVLLFTAVMLCMGLTQNANAQNEKSSNRIETVSFYGVDFSQAKIYGATETAQQFRDAFEGISNFFESEPKKYDTRKTFSVTTSELFNQQTKREIKNISDTELFTEDNRYELSDNQIHAIVAKLKKEGDHQYGAVIVCGLLNKIANQGTFAFVVFDQKTNEVIFNKAVSGRARGFGLRNFWAGALYAAIKNAR